MERVKGKLNNEHEIVGHCPCCNTQFTHTNEYYIINDPYVLVIECPVCGERFKMNL